MRYHEQSGAASAETFVASNRDFGTDGGGPVGMAATLQQQHQSTPETGALIPTQRGFFDPACMLFCVIYRSIRYWHHIVNWFHHITDTLFARYLALQWYRRQDNLCLKSPTYHRSGHGSTSRQVVTLAPPRFPLLFPTRMSRHGIPQCSTRATSFWLVQLVQVRKGSRTY